MSIAAARGLVKDASRIAALTGAGISTASGIPDFRGPQGRWTADPEAEKASSLSYYLTDQAVRVRAWRARVDSGYFSARPNPGHEALVGLERAGKLIGIITQNTDGLHQLAGSSPGLVHEVHGNARTWRCEGCAATGSMGDLLARVEAGEPDPRCPSCGGIVRARTILFGESLDPAVLDAAFAVVARADLLLVVGSTLTVYPAAGLVPYGVAQRGARLVIVNDAPTGFDDLADAVVREPIASALPAICAGE